jgi:hypothetical protein
MKTILFIFLLGSVYTIGLAQSASILLSPDNGVRANKTSYQQNYKIVVQTQSESNGFVQKTDPIEVGTFISETNGGYASYGTLGYELLSFTTNSNFENPQMTLNVFKFLGIGGIPYSALHVYGNAIITGAANVNSFVENAPLKVDNNGVLTSALHSYFYSFPRSAFMPTVNAVNNPIAESVEGGIYFSNAGLSYGLFEAPINLPTGAIITGVEFYFVDNSSSDIYFSLVATMLGSPYDVNFVDLLSSDAISGIRSISSNNINNGTGVYINDGFSYQLKIFALKEGSVAWEGANTQIVSAKIIYKL